MPALPPMSKKPHTLASVPEESLSFALHWRELQASVEPRLDAFEAKAADLDRWERKALKALKAGKSADVAFSSDVLDAELLWNLAAEVADCPDAASVKATFAAIKQQTLTSDEQTLADALLLIFERFETQTLRSIRDGSPLAFTSFSAALQSALLPAIITHAMSQLGILTDLIGPDFDPAAMVTEIAAWAGTYTAELTNGITETTRRVVENAITTYRATPAMTREALESVLRPAFGKHKAHTIAVTETTRAAAQSAAAYQQYLTTFGLDFERVNDTNADDRVCAVCGPLNGVAESDWSNSNGPPWHARCRCRVSLRRVK